MPRFKVRDLMINILPGAVGQPQVAIPEAQMAQVAMDLCAVTNNPLACHLGLTSPLCGVGCTDCTQCTQCTNCTQCTQCTCTNCSGGCTCSAACTNQCTGCTGYCTHQCTGCSQACTFACTGYCTNQCTNPSFCGATGCGATAGGCGGTGCGGTGCGATGFAGRGWFGIDTSDPVVLGELRAQLRSQLALVEAAERQAEEKLLPQTVAEVEMLEQKLTDAMEALRIRKHELEARQRSEPPQSGSDRSGAQKTDKP